MKVRILYKSDGSVAVIYPAPKSRRENESEVQWLKRIFDKVTPPNTEYEDVDASQLPKSREDREAWTGKKGSGVVVDITKAKKIRGEKERAALIQQKKTEILNRLALDELIAEGTLK